MTRLLLLASLCSATASAERGVFLLSLQAGQLVGVPTLERAVPLLATLEYGLAERWSIAGGVSGEFSPGAPVATISLGPRLTLFRSTWWTLEALLAPEALWTPGLQRFELGARVGLSARYLLLWGVGVLLEAGVRGRVEATGPFAPGVQGYLVCGLFMEA